MTDLLEISRAIIDEGKGPQDVGPINRINHALSEIADGVAVVEAFSHCLLFETEEGLLAFDTSNPEGGRLVVAAARGWRSDPFHTIVYTHGHVDHVGGCGAFIADAEARGHPRPCVCGHEHVARRFDRYRLTNGYNRIVNERQFGAFRRAGYDISSEARFLPDTSPSPDTTYRDRMDMTVGGLEVELHHAKGETDDHTWAFIPRHKAICAGDFFIWNFPNAGNPQKVQRYPLEWARALRAMSARDAELFLPAHGLPIAGAARIRSVLGDVAGALEGLVNDTLALMNGGARLDEILHTVKVAPEILEKPYLKPLYDEPEFVVRNIWRLYGGWYDGNPAHLKPAPDAALAAEVAALAGGAGRLAVRARELCSQDLRLACHLAEMAALAAPEDAAVHGLRAEVFQLRRDNEMSLMAKGVFGSAANASKARAEELSGGTGSAAGP